MEYVPVINPSLNESTKTVRDDQGLGNLLKYLLSVSRPGVHGPSDRFLVPSSCFSHFLTLRLNLPRTVGKRFCVPPLSLSSVPDYEEKLVTLPHGPSQSVLTLFLNTISGSLGPKIHHRRVQFGRLAVSVSHPTSLNNREYLLFGCPHTDIHGGQDLYTIHRRFYRKTRGTEDQ